jgi:tRNA A-37 threonylcarbamoyl transferase component Bud32
MSNAPPDGILDEEHEDAEDSAPSAVRPIGPNVGRYRLCFEIAGGGMAMVYLARVAGPESFEKVVALKCIHRHLAREREFVEMFLDEARIVSRIQHSNVCTLFDFGEADGTYYIAMEYLVGEPLGRVIRAVSKRTDLRRSADTPYFAARIIADACEGLHAAHELTDKNGSSLEVVHRDVSPHNLFVTYDGICKVMDFGIASARERIHHTRTGRVKGKFAYMAPEQLWRMPADRRADVWSLGVVLWEFVTMSRLFRRDTDLDTLQAALEQPIVPPSHINPNVPPELDAIVLRALARDRDERYKSARELGRDLTRFVASGKPMGLAELAEWMHDLFPEAEERKRELIARAAEASVTTPAEASAASRVEAKPKRRSTWIWWLGAALFFATGILAAAFGFGLVKVDPSSYGGSEERADRGSNDDEAASTLLPPAAVVAADSQRDAGPLRADAGTDAGPAALVADEPNEPTKRVVVVPAGPGTLAVVTPGGWATVHDGQGRLLGETPLHTELRSGRQILVIRPNGAPPAIRRVVTIRPGQVTRISVPMP